jgi:hypothetical protein
MADDLKLATFATSTVESLILQFCSDRHNFGGFDQFDGFNQFDG